MIEIYYFDIKTCNEHMQVITKNVGEIIKLTESIKAMSIPDYATLAKVWELFKTLSSLIKEEELSLGEITVSLEKMKSDAEYLSQEYTRIKYSMQEVDNFRKRLDCAKDTIIEKLREILTIYEKDMQEFIDNYNRRLQVYSKPIPKDMKGYGLKSNITIFDEYVSTSSGDSK